MIWRSFYFYLKKKEYNQLNLPGTPLLSRFNFLRNHFKYFYVALIDSFFKYTVANISGVNHLNNSNGENMRRKQHLGWTPYVLFPILEIHQDCIKCFSHKNVAKGVQIRWVHNQQCIVGILILCRKANSSFHDNTDWNLSKAVERNEKKSHHNKDMSVKLLIFWIKISCQDVDS